MPGRSSPPTARMLPSDERAIGGPQLAVRRQGPSEPIGEFVTPKDLLSRVRGPGDSKSSHEILPLSVARNIPHQCRQLAAIRGKGQGIDIVKLLLAFLRRD